ncbi:hypothetical protein Ancab_034912 [Ancistrocladus abbreviatus]
MSPTTTVATTMATAAATATKSAANRMVDSGLRRWNSPVPYLFGGLAVTLGLIAVALIMLACSFKKSSSTEANGEGGEKEAEMVAGKLDDEPKIVVIMAGDENPTYLAKPVPPATCCQQV